MVQLYQCWYFLISTNVDTDVVVSVQCDVCNETLFSNVPFIYFHFHVYHNQISTTPSVFDRFIWFNFLYDGMTSGYKSPRKKNSEKIFQNFFFHFLIWFCFRYDFLSIFDNWFWFLNICIRCFVTTRFAYDMKRKKLKLVKNCRRRKIFKICSKTQKSANNL